MADSTKEKKKTFRQKKPTTCPVCQGDFFKEELFSGGGRLIAGDLTTELRRLYQENKKYGSIYPLTYAVIVCPHCFYASLPEDFSAPVKDVKSNLHENTAKRMKVVRDFFPMLDFNDDRALEHGAASHILAVTSYSFFDKKFAPSLKKAISSIRAAWCLDDLYIDSQDERYAKVRDIFYQKSAIFYLNAIEYAQNGKEIMDNIKSYGPDIDKNYGYDGMLYMCSLMNYNIAQREPNLEIQAQSLVKSKRTVAKLFGMGKASKDKPTAILDKARDLYEILRDKVSQLEETLGVKLD